MFELLRDIALSFCSARTRSLHRPQSPLTVLRASILTGILQTLACSWWLVSGYKAFLLQRMEQYGHILNRANETTQAWFGGLFFVEYVLFHPLALLSLYLAMEGCIRFAGGLCVSEVIPSLPVVLVFAIKDRIGKRQEQRELERLASIPDAVDVLAGGDRFRIATAVAKPHWNPSLTIEIQGEWYEVEREERGTVPRAHVYLLRRAPAGKILRAYEKYDINNPMKLPRKHGEPV